jgi:hypothetical protein
MTALIILLLNLGASLFKPKSWLEAENAALRQQLVVLQRQVRGRVQFTNSGNTQDGVTAVGVPLDPIDQACFLNSSTRTRVFSL